MGIEVQYPSNLPDRSATKPFPLLTGEMRICTTGRPRRPLTGLGTFPQAASPRVQGFRAPVLGNHPGSVAPAPEATVKKVLIVDDEPDVLESTALMVELLGYEAITLSDPSEVLDTMLHEHPGLVLHDLKMPNVSIAGLVAALRSHPATADVPLVFFSANADLPTTAARYDAWGYLPKPFGKEELATLLHNVLGPPAGAGPAPLGSLLGPDGRRVFRQYWDAMEALARAVQDLQRFEHLSDGARQTMRALDGLLLRVAAGADAVHRQAAAMSRYLEAQEAAEAAGSAAEAEAVDARRNAP